MAITQYPASAGGSGDVTGPGSATSGHVAVFSGSTGKIIADGGALPTATIGGYLGGATVDLNEGTAAKQTIYTCPASRIAIVTGVVMHTLSADGAVANWRIGWTAGSEWAEQVSKIRAQRDKF